MNSKKILRFITIFLMIFYNFTGTFNSITKDLQSLILIMVIFAFFFLIFSEKYKRKDFNKIILLFFIVLVVFLITKNTNFLFLIIVSMVYYHGEKKELAKYFFISLLFNFLLIIIMNFFGIIPSHNLSRNGQIRYSLGFIHPNSVFLYYFLICCSLFYINDNKKIKFITLLVALLLYKYSLSRTGIISYFILLFLTSFDLEKIKWRKMTQYGFIIFTIFTILSTFLYSNNHFLFLNEIFSDRLYNYNYYINNGLLNSPFGLLNNSLSNLYTIDNLYLIIFYNYGFIGFIILIIAFIKSIDNIHNDNLFLKIVFSCLIYGICESSIILTNINFTLPILTLYLLNFKRVNENE